MSYPFKKIEHKWQSFWQEQQSYRTANQPQAKKCYVLEMLPYPSGKLHMGHVRNYSIGDAIARFKWMQGFDVLHPMGWDAFGLPAENAAIARGIKPDVWTYNNVSEMQAQLEALGFAYDWDRKLITCDPDYYQHEQRFFIEMHKRGLVYQAESLVNWDPVEQTVLANEQVVNGRGWRSNAIVEQKQMTQWFVAITQYAAELLKDLAQLKDWPEKVVKMQHNWIGYDADTEQYRLRDWGVSRQRYWGCPIPMIYCEQCGVVPEALKNLPVTLPKDVDMTSGGNPLDKHPTWKYTHCPQCQKEALRETDTLDTFFESSWYFLRYCCPHATEPLDKAICNTWMPVDFYIGGIEHAVMHLLYARFFTKALRDMGYLEIDEPFQKLIAQGMVCHVTYRTDDGQYHYPSEVRKEADGYYVGDQRVTVGRSEKMSKSKHNSVDPGDIIDKYGADVARLFVLSDTPPEKDFDWNDEGIDGCWRYLNKVWRLIEAMQTHTTPAAPQTDNELLRIAHGYLDGITKDYEDIALNKVIAKHRELVGHISDRYHTYSVKEVQDVAAVIIQTIAPLAPHIAHELWERCRKVSVMASWPAVDTSLLTHENMTIVVQINGKRRGEFAVPKTMPQAEIEVLARENAARYLEGKTVNKTVFVKDRMVSFVVTI